VRKGKIRNVELRVTTIQDLMLGVLSAPPGIDAIEAMYAAGYAVGTSWSRDFTPIAGDLDHVAADGLPSLLDNWAHYDATAGLGRFTFTCDGNRPTEIVVRNGFLSAERDGVDLRHVLAGYLAGSLEGLAAGRWHVDRVELVDKTQALDTYRVHLQAG